jgi:hypothetical protein
MLRYLLSMRVEGGGAELVLDTLQKKNMYLSLSEIEPQSLGRRALKYRLICSGSCTRARTRTHAHTHARRAARTGAENIVLSRTLWPWNEMQKLIWWNFLAISAAIFNMALFLQIFYSVWVFESVNVYWRGKLVFSFRTIIRTVYRLLEISVKVKHFILVV